MRVFFLNTSGCYKTRGECGPRLAKTKDIINGLLKPLFSFLEFVFEFLDNREYHDTHGFARDRNPSEKESNLKIPTAVL